MCKQSDTNTQTVVQNPQVPEWLSSRFQNLAGRAETTSNAPFNPGTQSNVADFTPDQLTAFQQTRDNQGLWMPYANQASDFAQIQGGAIDPGAINSYMNPFQQNVIDSTMANVQQNNQIQANNLTGNAALQGGLGNDRLGIAQGELARQQNLASNLTLAQLNAQNYNQALGAAQADRTAAGQAAQTYTNLGNQVSNLAAGDAARLAAAGGLQQGLTQQQMDTTTRNVQMQEQYPFATASWLGGVLQGASPSFTGYSQTTSQPAPSPWNTVLGLGSLGLGAYQSGLFGAMGLSDERLKENIREIGTDFAGNPIYAYNEIGSPETKIGYMAQDMLQSNPNAVVETPEGILMLDYDAATAPASAAQGGGGFGDMAPPLDGEILPPEGGTFADGGFVMPGRYTFGSQGDSMQPSSVGRQGPYPSASAQMMQRNQQGAQMMGNPVPPPPKPPKMKSSAEQMADEARDLKGAFDMGGSLTKSVGKTIGQASTTTGPGGWTTSTHPEGQGVGNYLQNTFASMGAGYADGGAVGGSFGNLGPYPAANAVVPGQPAPMPQPQPPAPAPAPQVAPQPQAMPDAGTFAGVPRPQAAPQQGGINPAGLGFMQAGLRMMQSRSPYPQVAFGEGGAFGLTAYQQAMAQEIEKRRQQEEADRLWAQYQLQIRKQQMDEIEAKRLADYQNRRLGVDDRRVTLEEQDAEDRRKLWRRQAMTPAEIEAENREARRREVEELRRLQTEGAAKGVREIDPLDRYAVTGKMPEPSKPIIVPPDAQLYDPDTNRVIAQGKPKGPDSTSRQAIYKAQDELPDVKATLDQLTELRQILAATEPGQGQPDNRPYYGAGAQSRSAWNQWAPGILPDMITDPNRAKATQRLNQLLSSEGLTQMSATLKGSSTDKEMAKFLEIYNDPSVGAEVKLKMVDGMLRRVQSHYQTKIDRIEELGGRMPDYIERDASGKATGGGPVGPKILGTKKIGNRSFVQVEDGGQTKWLEVTE